MEQGRVGILSKSVMYSNEPSDLAKKLFFFPLSAGHYYCKKDYNVKKITLNGFLFLHILNGNCYINTKTESYNAFKGQTIILNSSDSLECYSSGRSEFLWFNFDGQNSKELYDEIISLNKNVIDCTNKDCIVSSINNIIEFCYDTKSSNETIISLQIYSILCELILNNKNNSISNLISNENIIAAKKYIENNIETKLAVTDIANAVHMSTSHFSRVFKQQTGFTPYDYVLNARLDKAKEYLITTKMSITDIAFETGFNSESNFIYFFTNSTGLSPNKFRKGK